MVLQEVLLLHHYSEKEMQIVAPLIMKCNNVSYKTACECYKQMSHENVVKFFQKLFRHLNVYDSVVREFESWPEMWIEK